MSFSSTAVILNISQYFLTSTGTFTESSFLGAQNSHLCSLLICFPRLWMIPLPIVVLCHRLFPGFRQHDIYVAFAMRKEMFA